MGTNYVWRPTPCPTCGHGDELHICKSLRMFQGHFRWPQRYGDPEPWITSWKTWRAHFETAPGAIFDEYGQEIPTAQFIRDVEAVPADLRRRQYDWMATHGYDVDEVSPSGDWLDEDGFSFHGSDFS